jgi:mannose-6-phosphate isomerase-like protein (cupin superfamily)
MCYRSTMIAIDKQQIAGAEVALPCAELEATLAFFRDRLGFHLQAIFPADAPAVAVVAGHGLRLRLERGGEGAPGHIRLLCRNPDAVAGGERVLTAPNGTRVELVEAETPMVLPPLKPELVISRASGEGAFDAGRAGMLYRDLIRSRLGGRFIASHIRIPSGGPVPDYVHFHKIRFQMIFCRTGWVRLVYEDQGPPFVMEAGDCVLQPPQIRHRVLESSAGLEVIEIASPAVHETFAANVMTLPTAKLDPRRVFDGQRFLWHVAAKARWEPWRVLGFECRDTGMGEATKGLAGARVVRPKGASEVPRATHAREFQFFFVLDGAATLTCNGTHPLASGDAVTIPAGLPYALTRCTDDLSLLDVTLPA